MARPLVVAGEIESAAAALTRTLQDLDDAGWARTGVYPWPEPEVRSVEWMVGGRTVHELAHHLFDRRRLLA
jgi:hypothetical protein